MKKLSLSLTFATLTTTTAFGQIIASYSFTNDGAENADVTLAENVSFLNPDFASVDVLAGPFTFGAPLSPLVRATISDLFISEGRGLQDGTDNNISGAVDRGDFFGFTVTANEGSLLNLTDLQFEVGRAANGAQDYAIRSSVDDFATDIAFADDAITATLTNQVIDLSGFAFSDLSAIELRIYFDDRVSNNGTSSATFIDTVVLNGAIIANLDSDGDGLSNDFENANLAAGYDPNVDNSNDDFDNDASTTAQELAAGTNVLDPDTDGDGFNDGAEDGGGTFVSFDAATNTGMTGTNPLIPDTDEDGLPDGVERNTGDFVDELNTGSDPNIADTDGDGLSDNFETINNAVGYDPNEDDSQSDFDDDASTVENELAAGTNVLLADTDGDGFWDGAETNTATFVSYDFTANRGDTGTNPLVADTDGDGLMDGEEPPLGANPTLTDSDGDGLSDGAEVNGSPATSPSAADSDNDGVNDGTELRLGNDPNDAADTPDILVEYNYNDFDLVADLVADGVIATDTSTGAALTILQTGSLPNAFVNGANGLSAEFTDGDSALAAGQTFTFGIAAENGGILDLSDLSLSFDVARNAVRGALNFAVFVDVNGSGTFTLFGQASNDIPSTFAESLSSLGDDVSSLDVQVALFNRPVGNVNSSATTLDNVLFAVLPVETDLVLCIEDDPAVDGNFLLSFNSEAGASYDLRSSTDLTGDPLEWTIVVPDIAADPSGTNSESVSIAGAERLFFVVTEQ